MLHCPGADKIRIPDLEIKKCPVCDGEIEIFSNEFQARCEACGFVAYKDLSSCIRWCKYAEECLGTELFQQLHDKADP